MAREALIVGIDPGNTSAVAALNLDGELVMLESRREFSHDEIIRELVEKGKPVVVASDKKEMPSTVEKIASSLGAERFEPEEDLATAKKKELGKGENSHEQDAHASVNYAYNCLQKEIRKINKHSDESDSPRNEVAKKYFEDEGFMPRQRLEEK